MMMHLPLRALILRRVDQRIHIPALEQQPFVKRSSRSVPFHFARACAQSHAWRARR